MQVLYLGRAPRTKETLPDFCEKCRVTRHSRVFRGLTGSQRTPGNWGVTRCEASEAESSIERLTYECHALRGDFQRQEALVVQRDGAIASLRDEAYTQWASGRLAFQKSPFLLIALERQPPRLRPAPLLHLLLLTSHLTSEPPCTILLIFYLPWTLNPRYM